MPSADFRTAVGRNCLRPSLSPASGRCLFSLFSAWFPGGATVSRPYLWNRQPCGSPGVSTYLCPHERRVYLPGLRRIEDFALCCRLVPPGLTRFLFIAPRTCGIPLKLGTASFRGPVAGNPVALPLDPSPPSGWMRDLPLALLRAPRRTR
jgi:hypothetical protein